MLLNVLLAAVAAVPAAKALGLGATLWVQRPVKPIETGKFPVSRLYFDAVPHDISDLTGQHLEYRTMVDAAVADDERYGLGVFPDTTETKPETPVSDKIAARRVKYDDGTETYLTKNGSQVRVGVAVPDDIPTRITAKAILAYRDEMAETMPRDVADKTLQKAAVRFLMERGCGFAFIEGRELIVRGTRSGTEYWDPVVWRWREWRDSGGMPIRLVMRPALSLGILAAHIEHNPQYGHFRYIGND